MPPMHAYYRFMRHPLIALAAVLLLASIAGAVPRPMQGLDMRVLFPPSAHRMNGEITLLYELILTNVSSGPVEIERIDVIDRGSGKIVASRSGVALAEATGLVGNPGSRGLLQVPSGRSAITYMDVALPEGSVTPGGLKHRVAIHGDSSSKSTVGGAETAVTVQRLPRLGPPLRGGLWAAVYDRGLARGHRRYVYATSGRAVIPGRYAIDWMAVGGAGDGEGAEVLAVADGVVVAARDGVIRSVQSGSLGESAGNFLAIDIGRGFTAFYEHLRPGLAVRPGDRVVRGQPIATLGSTGQALRPHLHFHLASGRDPLAADGVPYVLDGFIVVGSFRDVVAASTNGRWYKRAPGQGERSDLPPPNTVVSFD